MTLEMGVFDVCSRSVQKSRCCNKAISRGITLISMDMIPRRLSRAQSMDVNSSQDTSQVTKPFCSELLHVPKGIPMMTTSAGTVKPAKFVVMGSG